MIKNEPLFTKVAVIGVGLLGGSLCCDLVARNVAFHVAVWDPSSAVLNEALERGMAHTACQSACEAAEGADVVVVASPPQHIPDVLNELVATAMQPGLITDLGSVKSPVCTVGEALYGTRFVGGHPMAGSALSGISASHEGLFIGAPWAVVRTERPVEETGSPTETLCRLIRAVGGKPLLLTPNEHDEYTALVSHLPHMLSFAFQSLVDHSQNRDAALQLAAGSYRDFSRISNANPEMWDAIFKQNRAQILDITQKFVTKLQAMCGDLENDI